MVCSAEEANQEAERATGVARLLYGALVAGAAVAVSAGSGDTPAQIAIATVVSLIVYWLAHVYSAVLGERIAFPGARLRERLGHAIGHETPIIFGGLPTVVVFAVAVLAGAGTSLAAWLGLAGSVSMLAGAGAIAARRAGVSGLGLAAEAASAAVLGGMVAALKILVH